MAKSCCEICHSPNYTGCNHFDAKSCKACAAFFRRTVSMGMEYVCLQIPDACLVRYDSRQICRYCRYEKCISVGMKPNAVLSKTKTKQYIRITKGLVKKRKLGESEVENEPINVPGPSTDSSAAEILNIFVDLENSINDRRRLLYAGESITKLFEMNMDWPYSRESLKLFNLNNHNGMSKSDFVTVLDYSKGVPGYAEIRHNHSDTVFWYRLMCAVDFVMNSAWYSYRNGIETNQLILTDGRFVVMEGTPMTGYEEEAAGMFETKDELSKYRTLMPLLIEQWKVCTSLAELGLSFEEFAVLKGICCWHVAYYRLSQDGREVCIKNRDMLMKALELACYQRTDLETDVMERYGSLLLSLSYIMEQVRNVCCSFVMISTFSIFEVDQLMVDVTQFWK